MKIFLFFIKKCERRVSPFIDMRISAEIEGVLSLLAIGYSNSPLIVLRN